MENKKIIMLRHHPLGVKYTNVFYTSQVDGDLSEYEVFDVTSRSERNKEFMKAHPTFVKDLSPFFLGPVVASDGTVANIFELLWQAGKVYPCHDDNGRPNSDFFKWRNKFYAMTSCERGLMRHPCKSLGYDHKDQLYYPYFNKDKNEYDCLGYVESRKRVYFSEYAKLIYKSESFQYLKSLVDSGRKIALVDFDGYNYYFEGAMKKQFIAYVNKCKKLGVKPTVPESEFVKIKSMKDVINCPFMSAGHGFVIKALLQGDIEVVDGEIIDNIGLLK